VNVEKANETIRYYQNASRYWTGYFNVEDGYPITWVLMSENDYDWWYSKVTELQGNNSIYPWDPKTNIFGHCQLSIKAFCGYGNTQIGTNGKHTLFQYNVIGSEFKDKPVGNTVNHETVHFYQLSNIIGFPSDLPCWYTEGQASFYGNVLSDTNDRNYEINRFSKSFPNAKNLDSKGWVKLLDDFQKKSGSVSNRFKKLFIGFTHLGVFID